MNSITIFEQVIELYKWLKSLGLKSNIELPTEVKWARLDKPIRPPIAEAPGVYFVRLVKGHSEIDNLGTDLVLIDSSDNLRQRIRMLREAIKTGKTAHAGGKALREKFGENPSIFEVSWLLASNPHVARLFEYYLLLRFYETHGQLPVGNKE